GLPFAELGRPVPAADQCLELAGVGCRGLGLVGPAPHRPVDAADGRHPPGTALAGHFRIGSRGAARPGCARARAPGCRGRRTGADAADARSTTLRPRCSGPARHGPDPALRCSGTATAPEPMTPDPALSRRM